MVVSFAFVAWSAAITIKHNHGRRR
jgi:hypothetical protein